MKYLSLFIALLCFEFVSAQTNVKTEIREATVFLQAAQITRTGKATLNKGRGSIVLTGLSPQLDASSVRLGATGDFTILTVTPRTNYLEPKMDSPEFKKLDNQKKELNERTARQQIDIDVLTEEERVMMANKAIGGSQSGVSVDELQKMATYFNTRLKAIRNERYDINKALNENKQELQKINQQLNELQKGQRKHVAEVVVQYQANNSTNAEFQLTYLVNGASWSPTYDLRVADLNKSVDLSYGALVRQATGEDWNKIELTLSTANPRQQQNAPIVRTWWLSEYQPIAQFQPRAYEAEEKIVQMSNAVITRADLAADADFAGADVSVNMTNTEFKVRLKQDIPSNGQEHRVLVDDYELPADYQYYAAPKLDCHVYLTARVTDWQKYSLLPGQVNLFFDGAYVGKSSLQTQAASDTLVFSLGKDKGLVIQREREEDYRSRKFLGSKTEQKVGWRIKVQKNRRNDIPLIIEDQIPVSTTDQITVELDQAKGAKVDEATGKLRWELKMKFGEQKEIGFRYTVKHPKNMAIRLE